MTKFAGIHVGLAMFALLSLFAQSAAAQSPVYVTGSGFADVKRFSSVEGAIYSGEEEEFSLDGTSAGGGLRIGTFLSPRVSLELSVDAGSRTTVDLPNPYAYLLSAIPSLRGLNFTSSTQVLTVGAMVGFHAPARGRVRLGYLGGFSFVRSTFRESYPSFGEAIYSTAVFETPTRPSPSLTVPVGPIVFPPIPVRQLTLAQHTNSAAATLGIEAEVALVAHLAVVPEIRALTFAIANGGPSTFLIRPGVGVRWSF